jgi:hypothetical protein
MKKILLALLYLVSVHTFTMDIDLAQYKYEYKELNKLINRANVDALQKFLYLHPGILTKQKFHKDTTSLHNVCMNFNPDALEVLLKNGAIALLGVKDSDGETPLKIACNMSDIKSVRVLLLYGAAEFINVLDDSGDTPLDSAMANGNVELIKLLEQHGAVRGAQEQELPFMPPLLARQNAIIREDFGAGGGGGGAARDPGYLYLEELRMDVGDDLYKAKNIKGDISIEDISIILTNDHLAEIDRYEQAFTFQYTFTLHFNNGTQHEIVFPRGIDYQRFMQAVEDYVELKEIESIYLTDEDGIDLDGRVLSYRLDFDLAQKSEFIEAITQGKVAENQHLVVMMHQDRQA